MIDPAVGTIVLPSGFTVTPGLTKKEFKESNAFEGEPPYTQHAVDDGWETYSFKGGAFPGNWQICGTLHFFDEELTHIILDLRGPDEDGGYPSEEQLDAQKAYLDNLLRIDLGEPHEIQKHSVDTRPLEYTLHYRFAWGYLSSVYVRYQDGSVFGKIFYGDRFERASQISQERVAGQRAIRK